MLNFKMESALKFIENNELDSLKVEVSEALKKLNEKNGEGSDFLGWVGYPLNYDKNEFLRIKKAAATISRNSEVLVVIGIGGSYLGAKAVCSALSPYFTETGVEVIFAGNTISSSYLVQLRDYLWNKDFSVNVVSKSGTTTEPALTYRFLFDILKKKYMKEELKEHIFLTTDKARGALHQIGVENDFEMFTVPDDMGGRYSVFSAVGLLPICAMGLDIDKLMEGAKDAFLENNKEGSAAYNYALIRNALYKKDFNIEILESYEPNLLYISEWWKQLFGESEGKDLKGIFPASCIFTTDLHSMGQYIQEGRRNLFETVITIKEPLQDTDIPFDKANLDNLNYLAGKSLDYVNKTAQKATSLAHEDGGVPQLEIEIDEIDEYNIGYLLYFFMMACGISGYTLGVNPFNQPGVEAYKTNMFKFLGKPGYENK